eukprot:3377625-Rhodomonas_salina.2
MYTRFSRDWGRGITSPLVPTHTGLCILASSDTGLSISGSVSDGVLTRMRLASSPDPQAPSRVVVCVGCGMSDADRRVSICAGPLVHAVAKLYRRRVCGGV